MTEPVLAIRQVSRLFGPVQVLFDVDFDLRPGEVHALIGENGAGKSTTMKILAGYLAPSAGEVLLDGKPVHFPSSREAEAAGIVMIHQEFNLATPLTVEENIFLGRELKRGPFLDHRAMQAESRRLLERLHCTVDPRARVSTLSVPNRQMVEIAKALGLKARVLIMDEPTAVLTHRETDTLLEQVDRLRASGTSILYTSHKLDEVARIADRVTVLRDGRRVMTAPAKGLSEDRMAETMVGRELSGLFPPKSPPAPEPVLKVTGLTVPGFVRDASFTPAPRRGAGLRGSRGLGPDRVDGGDRWSAPGHGRGADGRFPPAPPFRVGGARGGPRLPDGGPQGEGPPPRQAAGREPHPSRARPLRARADRQGGRGSRPDAGDLGLRHPGGRPRDQRGQPLGREPAEAASGQDHAGRAACRHHRRAHPRDRRRHQAADLRLHRPPSPPRAAASSSSRPNCPR